jgi:hypothetical protein
MRPYFNGAKLAFCIYHLIHGFVAIKRGEQFSPIEFTLVVAILLLDVIIVILEDLIK